MPTIPRAGAAVHAFAALALTAVSAIAPPPSRATTYAPIADEALVEQAPAVGVLRVLRQAPAAPAAAATDYEMAVERVLKGTLPGSTVTVRVPGGVGPARRTLRVWGAPRFREGERVLLFLAPRRDGSYGVLHLMLGAFHEVQVAGHRLALRDLGEAREVLGPGAAEPARDFGRFARWVARRAAGLRPLSSYVVELPPGPARVVERFTYLGGSKHRWFEFDADQAVGWRAHEDGQPGVAGGGFAEFQTAIEAWNGDANSHVLYQYDGTTTASGGFSFSDDVNAILFEDPNDDAPGTFTCSSPGIGSGVLAVGGVWSAGVPEGDATPIAEGDIVVNDGAGCWFVTPQRAEQVYGHELGHTLGLGHSCGGSEGFCGPVTNEALMRAFAHPDNRGASLGADDRAGIRSLYPAPYAFFTVTPCRLIDTRGAIGPFGGPALTSGVAREITVGGQCGVPAMAGAVAVNVTVVSATGGGHLTFFATDVPVPDATSLINFAPGQTRANNAVLALSSEISGRITVLPVVAGLGSVHLIVDVNGYFH